MCFAHMTILCVLLPTLFLLHLLSVFPRLGMQSKLKFSRYGGGVAGVSQDTESEGGTCDTTWSTYHKNFKDNLGEMKGGE
jgi:hypothetical protein